MIYNIDGSVAMHCSRISLNQCQQIQWSWTESTLLACSVIKSFTSLRSLATNKLH